MSSSLEIQDGRRLRRADSRLRIYDAAMLLLETHGFDDLSIDDICREAGVGRATFFRIYKTKAALLLEFNRRLALRAAARPEVLENTNARDALFAIGEEIAGAWSEVSPSATALAVEFVRTLAASDPHEAHPELLKLVTNVVERGIERGELRATFTPEFLGSMALIQICAAAMLWFEDSDQDLSRLILEAVDHWFNGAGRKTA